jgi:hypothetical protein
MFVPPTMRQSEGPLVLTSDRASRTPGREPAWTIEEIDRELQRLYRAHAVDPRVLRAVCDAWLDERLRAEP